jgi:hypothetical protein
MFFFSFMATLKRNLTYFNDDGVFFEFSRHFEGHFSSFEDSKHA